MNLVAENSLIVRVEGPVGSSVNIEMVSPGTLVDSNSVPMVADVSLETTVHSRSASRVLSISDADMEQSHISEILNFSENGWASLISNEFTYSGFFGFKGLDVFYILTRDDGRPQKGVVSKVSVDVQLNTSPQLPQTQSFVVAKDSSPFVVNLLPGVDPEGDSLTYSLVQAPTEGRLSDCLGGTGDLLCNYTPPAGFTGNVSLTYMVSDGSVNSRVSNVTLRVISFSSIIKQVAMVQTTPVSC